MEQRKQMIDTMIKIAGVRFHANWKVYDFDATDIEVAVGDKVIIDSDRGLDVAQVVRLRRSQAPAGTELSPQAGLEEELPTEGDEKPASSGAPSPAATKPTRGLRKILRKATEEDLSRDEKNRARDTEAFSVAQAMIAERELPMRLIRAEYSFDASRVTFFFFSETRVDFRELVKDLAHKLKSRIEMRQVGVRDVARMIGGFGPCGRELCCSSFLKNFEPVSIRMAKKQEMVLNPAKISGVCGRLLCCLSYEFEMYDENKKDLAAMRETAMSEKRAEEELRFAEERKAADESREEEDKRRREDRREQQDQRRDKQREGGQRGGRPEKKKDAQQERKAQPRAEQSRERQQPKQDKQQPRPEQSRERQQPKQDKLLQRTDQPRDLQQLKPGQLPPVEQDQKAEQPAGEVPAKKKRRKFWRRKKKGPQQSENKPQGPGSA
jgi:cell fate regulator YaaT (PSP1 superfamily)